MKSRITRRDFLAAASAIGSVAAWAGLPNSFGRDYPARGPVPVYGHLWVYASQFPPDWDCTPILGRVFDDFKYAGIEGVEVMESILRNPDILEVASELIETRGLPIVGSSYYADMWRKEERQRILEDVEFVVGRLAQLGGSIFGITVGDAGRVKSEPELDAQAEVLREVQRICAGKGVQPNIHNHTFEVSNELHDLKGILSRVPDMKLGPDVSWLAKAGVDPVSFIREFGDRIVYLHLRDNTAGGRFAEAVGDGAIDFPAIAQALEEVGFRGEAAIELAYEGEPSRSNRENWKISRDYVAKVFGW